LTGDQHTEHILKGQQPIRYAGQPNVFYFFSTAQNILNFFARNTSQRFAKPKEPFFSYAPETAEINISKFVELLLKIYFTKSLVNRKLCLLL
jgi:hypothetical protein